MHNSTARLLHGSRQATRLALTVAGAGMLLAASSAPSVMAANGYQPGEIGNNPDHCRAGAGPALSVTVTDVKTSEGRIRVQTYRATQAEWLAKGRWLNRIEIPARAGTMTFCLPLPDNGTYGVAVRHDINGNGKTDISRDGGGMSNNPAINIFNLGKPSFTKVGVAVRDEVKAIRIQMKYM